MKTRLYQGTLIPVLALLILLLTLPQTAVGLPTGTPSTTYTESNETINDIVSTATVNQQVNQFSVELIAQMAGGNVLFDQTFSVTYTDPTVQAAVVSAENVLTGAGATSFTGPTLTSNLTALTGETSNTVQTLLSADVTSIVTGEYIGPQTIMTGDNQSVPFIIPAGGVDFDTLVTYQDDYSQTTTITDTYLTTQTYDLVGTPASTTVPEPATMLLLGLGLMGLAGARRKFKK